MAVVGAKPKEDRSQIRHRHPPTQEWIEVEDVPFDGAPPLPARDDPRFAGDKPTHLMDQSGIWPRSTLRWWRVISTAPHAILWTADDWEYAVATAEAHARFAEGWKGCASGAELRMREKLLGMTMDARRDLRIRYIPPKPKADPDALPADVARLDDYRGL